MRPDPEDVKTRPRTTFHCFSPSYLQFPFEWHYHDSFELTYVVGGHGTRFVGDHMDGFDGTDLVLIGRSLPHAYQSASKPSGRSDNAVVVHFTDDFLRTGEAPYREFEAIHNLLRTAQLGISFPKDVTRDVAVTLLRLPDLEPFEQHLSVLQILHHLAQNGDGSTLSTPGFGSLRRFENEEKVTRICAEIHRRARESITLDELALMVNMSSAGLSRFFKRATGRTFKRYLNEVRVETACTLLVRTEMSISDICFEAGFQNVSNFNRRFLQIRSVAPMEYRRRRRNDGRQNPQ